MTLQTLQRTVAVSALVAALAPAWASVAPPLTLEQQAGKAEVIVRGELGTPQLIEGEGSSKVRWRAYPLTVTEIVTGDPARLPQLEGTPALYVWSEVNGLPEWKTGADAFFLLYTGRSDSPLVGFNQGYYALEGEQVTVSGERLSVDDFRRRVLAARGEAAPAVMPPATTPPPEAPTVPQPSEPLPTPSAPAPASDAPTGSTPDGGDK